MSPVYSRTFGLAIMLVSLAVPGVCQAQKSCTSADDNAVATPGDPREAASTMLVKASCDSTFEDTAEGTTGVTERAATGTPAKKFHRVIQPNQTVEPLSMGDKLELSIMSRFTMTDVASTAFAAGWSQLRDSAPHFGTDSGAFGDRLGGLAIKQTSQSIFSYGIYAGVFHDDPRYYVMGRDKSIGARALYSASRLVITQKDDGRATINWPKFAGIASATALTNAYYPAQDHGFANGAKAFGVSLGTSILNNEIHEFIGDGLRLVRRNRN